MRVLHFFLEVLHLPIPAVYFFVPRCLCRTQKREFPNSDCDLTNDTVSVAISLVPGYLTSRLPPKMERSKPRMPRPDMARFFCFVLTLD